MQVVEMLIIVKAITFKRVRVGVTRRFQKQGRRVGGLNKNYVLRKRGISKKM